MIKTKRKTKRKSKCGRKLIKLIGFFKAIDYVIKQVLKTKPTPLGDVIKLAMKSAKSIKKQIKLTHTEKIPKSRDILPAIPNFVKLNSLVR